MNLSWLSMPLLQIRILDIWKRIADTVRIRTADISVHLADIKIYLANIEYTLRIIWEWFTNTWVLNYMQYHEGN